MVNKVLIMELHMINKFVSNNYRIEGFGNICDYARIYIFVCIYNILIIYMEGFV
jgi:hypothetical protein